MKLSEVIRQPIKLKGGGSIYLEGLAKQIIDKEVGDTPPHYIKFDDMTVNVTDGSKTQHILIGSFDNNLIDVPQHIPYIIVGICKVNGTFVNIYEYYNTEVQYLSIRLRSDGPSYTDIRFYLSATDSYEAGAIYLVTQKSGPNAPTGQFLIENIYILNHITV